MRIDLPADIEAERVSVLMPFGVALSSDRGTVVFARSAFRKAAERAGKTVLSHDGALISWTTEDAGLRLIFAACGAPDSIVRLDFVPLHGHRPSGLVTEAKIKQLTLVPPSPWSRLRKFFNKFSLAQSAGKSGQRTAHNANA